MAERYVRVERIDYDSKGCDNCGTYDEPNVAQTSHGIGTLSLCRKCSRQIAVELLVAAGAPQPTANAV